MFGLRRHLPWHRNNLAEAAKRQLEADRVVGHAVACRFISRLQFWHLLSPALELRATDRVLVNVLGEQNLCPQRLERVATAQPDHETNQAVQALGVGGTTLTVAVPTLSILNLTHRGHPCLKW